MTLYGMWGVHEFDRRVDNWGVTVYCRCGLTFAERYKKEAWPRIKTSESEEERNRAMAAADQRHAEHRDQFVCHGTVWYSEQSGYSCELPKDHEGEHSAPSRTTP